MLGEESIRPMPKVPRTELLPTRVAPPTTKLPWTSLEPSTIRPAEPWRKTAKLKESRRRARPTSSMMRRRRSRPTRSMMTLRPWLQVRQQLPLLVLRRFSTRVTVKRQMRPMCSKRPGSDTTMVSSVSASPMNPQMSLPRPLDRQMLQLPNQRSAASFQYRSRPRAFRPWTRM